MKDVIQYNGFLGSVRFSAKDECLFGRIEGIDDVVTFKGRNVKELKRAFQDAVNDHIELCESTGKPLRKSYRGVFNVRTNPELHKKAALKA